MISPLRMPINANRAQILMVAAFYLASTFVHTGNRTIFPGLPRVLSGDSPHYLVVVKSLIEDGDFDVSNNYRQGRAGGLDFGRRLSGTPLDNHSEMDRNGVELSVHAPFYPLMLAPFAWPFRGTEWVEPVCIWVSLAGTLAGVFLFGQLAGWQWAAALALATPFWSYARDLWTEPWTASCWIGLLVFRHPVAVAAFSFLGTLLKYPFALVPLVFALFAAYERNFKRAAVLAGSTALALLSAIAFVQYLFQDSNHFSLFHLGSHAGFTWPFQGMAGLLLDPRDGLLWFSPFLAWGFWSFRKGGPVYLAAFAFFMVHAGYEYWMGGTGFSARYLAPMLPVLALAAGEADIRRGWIFRGAVLWSLLWGFIGGFLPAVVYDRSVWEMILRVF